MADDATLSLYDTDFYLWTQAQAAALRAHRQGEQPLDYDRLAEEIEDLGASERNKVRSWIRLIIEHSISFTRPGAMNPSATGSVRLVIFAPMPKML